MRVESLLAAVLLASASACSDSSSRGLPPAPSAATQAAALQSGSAAGTGSSGAAQASSAAFQRIPVNVPSGPLTQLAPTYLSQGGDPVHVPHVLEADRFSDRLPAQVPALLKVVTWNVEWGKKTQRVSSRLSTDPDLADADVLLLTELPRHDPESNPPGINLARDLAQTLRMNYVQAPEWDRRLEVHNGGEHTSAILSKYPIGNVTHLRHQPSWNHYRSNQRIGGRHTIGADLLIGGKRVRFYVVHFSTRDAGWNRDQQLGEVLQDLALPGRPREVVLGGDFNTWTCNPTVVDCTQPANAEPAVSRLLQGGFVDGTAGFTSFSQLGLNVLPQRLDWIFVRGLPTVPGSGKTTGASDHLPLWSQVQVR